MNLTFQQLPSTIRGIYRVKGVVGCMPERALKLNLGAAVSLGALEIGTDGLIYSDLWRSAEASLAAMQSKRGVQPPGRSAHNFGLAVDIAVDDYEPPGTPPRSPKSQGTLSLRGWTYEHLLEVLGSYGWYCHRRDGKRGLEDWHFNWLGEYKYEALLTTNIDRPSTWANAAEFMIQRYHRTDFALDSRAVQLALGKLGLYRGEADGIIGPLSREAISAFQRAWKLSENGLADAQTQRTLAFVAADIEIIP